MKVHTLLTLQHQLAGVEDPENGKTLAQELKLQPQHEAVICISALNV